MITLFLICMFAITLAKENNNLKVNKSTVKYKIRKVSQTDEELQKYLFTAPATNCVAPAVELEEIKEEIQKESNFNKGSKVDLWWVKPWGYGASAYFFDFLQPVLMEKFVAEGQAIYDRVFAMDKDKHGNYKDPFDYDNFLSEDMSEAEKTKIRNNKKLVNANYVEEVFKVSVNAVQLHKAMKEWKWTTDLKTDYSKELIDLYDADGDGRLNIREFILATIDYNKKNQDKLDTKFIFTEMIKYCAAIFTFVDCDENGYVSTEELHKNLKNLTRDGAAGKYNIYGANKDMRLSAANDFMLKCHSSKNGLLTKQEFTSCILFAFWNRQATKTKLIKDNSRNLADLRWGSSGKKDLAFEKSLVA